VVARRELETFCAVCQRKNPNQTTSAQRADATAADPACIRSR
jgi:hypothetical protein